MRAPVAARFGKALLSPAIVTRGGARAPGRRRPSSARAARPRPCRVAFVSTHRQVPIVVTYHCDLRPPPGVVQRFIETIARASQNFALDRAAVVVTYTEDYARTHGGARRNVPSA